MSLELRKVGANKPDAKMEHFFGAVLVWPLADPLTACLPERRGCSSAGPT